MSMADEIKKALEPMTQEITELTEKVDQLALHVAEMEEKQGTLGKQIAAGLLTISEKKSAGAEAVAPLKKIVNEIKDDLKKAGAEAMQQLKETKNAKDDNETDWKQVALVFGGLFVVTLFASAVSEWYYKDKPRIDYAERILYNMQYADDGTGRDGSGIRLFEEEKEARRIMNNQFRYEQSQVDQ